MKKYLFISILSLMFISCDEDFFNTTLDVDPPKHTPRLVVHAFTSVNKPVLKVRVSYSIGIADLINGASSTNINDAVVTISKENEAPINVPFFSSFGFNYYFNFPENYLEPGATYTLTVEADGYPAVRSTQVAPELIEITELKFSANGGTNSEGDDRSELDFNIDDPVDEENYYEVAALFDWSETGNPQQAQLTYLESLDPVFYRGYEFEALLIDDASFNGEQKKLNVKMFEITDQQADEVLFVRWRSVTEDYYQFSRTLRAFREVGDNPFLSPVQIYSNIENGIGIFSISNDIYYKY